MRRQTAILLAVVGMGVVILGAGGLGAAYYLRNEARRVDGRRQVESYVSVLEVTNRSFAMKRAGVYWLEREPGSKAVEQLLKDSDALYERVKEMRRRHDQEWGNDRRPLGDLSPKRLQGYDDLRERTDRFLDACLLNNYRLMSVDCDRLRAELPKEFPLKLDRPAGYDRSTVEGERLYREEEQLLPLKQKLTLATHKRKIAEAYASRRPAIVDKWVAKTRQDIEQELSQLGQSFRDAR